MRTLLQAGARVQQAFERRIPDAAAFAEHNRVLLLRTLDGFGVDIALGAMPFEASAIERSSNAELVPDQLERVAQRAETVIGPFDHKRPQ